MATTTGNPQCPPGYYYFRTTLDNPAATEPYQYTGFDYMANSAYVTQNDMKIVMDRLAQLKEPYMKKVANFRSMMKGFGALICVLILVMMIAMPLSFASSEPGDGPPVIIFIMPALIFVAMFGFMCFTFKFNSSLQTVQQQYDSECEGFLNEQNNRVRDRGVQWSHHLTTEIHIGAKRRASQRRVSYIRLSTPVSAQQMMNPAQMMMMQNPMMMQQQNQMMMQQQQNQMMMMQAGTTYQTAGVAGNSGNMYGGTEMTYAGADNTGAERSNQYTYGGQQTGSNFKLHVLP